MVIEKLSGVTAAPQLTGARPAQGPAQPTAAQAAIASADTVQLTSEAARAASRAAREDTQGRALIDKHLGAFVARPYDSLLLDVGYAASKVWGQWQFEREARKAPAGVLEAAIRYTETHPRGDKATGQALDRMKDILEGEQARRAGKEAPRSVPIPWPLNPLVWPLTIS